MVGTAATAMKRIPRIRFPQRQPKHSSSASETAAMSDSIQASTNFSRSSDVPAVPKNTAVGGKASLQPKRTPVSDGEIEAIMTTLYRRVPDWLDSFQQPQVYKKRLK